MPVFSQTWNSTDGSFYLNLFKYMDACKKSGKLPSQKDEEETRKLYFWNANVRSAFRNGKMSVEKAAVMLKYMNWATPGGTENVEDWLKTIGDRMKEFMEQIVDGEGPTEDELLDAKEVMEARANMSEEERAAERSSRGTAGARAKRTKGTRERVRVVSPKYPDEEGFVPTPKPEWAEEASKLGRVKDREQSEAVSPIQEAMRRIMGNVERRTVPGREQSEVEGHEPEDTEEQETTTEVEETETVKKVWKPFGFANETMKVTEVLLNLGYSNRDEVYEDMSRYIYSADRIRLVEKMGLSRDMAIHVEQGFLREWLGFSITRRRVKKAPKKGDAIIIEDGKVLNPFYM